MKCLSIYILTFFYSKESENSEKIHILWKNVIVKNNRIIWKNQFFIKKEIFMRKYIFHRNSYNIMITL